MHFNEIDDIIKRGLQDSERKSDDFAMEAKLRIWDSIEKPKKKSGLSHGFILAMAAAVAFFLISTILFLKLQSMQEELMTMKTPVNQRIPTIAFQEENPKQEDNKNEEMNPQKTEEKVNLSKTKEIIPKKQKENIAQVIYSEEELPINEMISIIEIDSKIQEADLLITETNIIELKTDLVSPIEITEESPIKPKPKTKNKLRIKFGNSNPNYNSENSLALNFKL